MNAIKTFSVAIGLLVFTAFSTTAQTQTKTLTLDEAVTLGLQNSKQLKRSQYKIDEALSRVEQAKDGRLPSAKVSFQYLHALMLSRVIQIPGLTKDAVKMPLDFPAYLGTATISEPIFAGNQLKYARQSADLMVQMSRLDADKDKDDISWVVIESYINYNKILQNQLIVAQNMQDIQGKLEEITKYESQGLATKNDVLRYQLQQSQLQLTEIELENNRRIANFNMNVLLGLPDSTQLILPAPVYKLNETPVFTDLLQTAESNRRELQDISYETKLSDINVKQIKDKKLPTVAASGGIYYINPTGDILPTHNNLIAPVTLGIGASWDIGTMWNNKNKVREAQLQREDLNTAKSQAVDEIHKDVNKNYILYKVALEKIKVLQDAVTQAEENERITESKFKNNLVNTTDRIDAQTLLYQARVNLELAKSDATIAYYDLLHSTGKIAL
jgi:outer membrane protein TolC